MAAYAALVSLMNNIEQMMKHPRVSDYLDNKQIQPLLEKAGLLFDIVEANNYGGGSKEAEDLERQITSAAHAAEDVIESHIVDQIHDFEDVNESHIADKMLDGDTSPSFLRKVQKRIRDMKTKVQHLKKKMARAYHIHAGTICSLDLQQVIRDMDVVVEKSMDLVKEKDGFRVEKLTHSTPLLESGETAMVGLDDELTQLMDELTGHQSNRHIISIVGMGGMGKTTLAKNIYANPLIIEHFDIRAWATVSQQHNAREVLSQLISSLGELTIGSVGELGEQLYKTLIGRRYLVILDDIWSVEAWDEVRRYLPNDGNKSRVVLTTRLSNVASVCGSSCFTMNLLDEDKSWKLFCQKAHFPQNEDPLQLKDVGKEIVRLCKGLALSIVVIGGFLLKSPRTVGFWKGVAITLKSNPNSKEKQQSLNVLSLSYNQLPPHLKPCFLYMRAFDEDSEIRVSNITKHWVAEGFIRPNGTQILEEIAEAYLKDLIDRNLILVTRRRSNGKIGSCGIHDLLRDLCVKLARQEQFFYGRRVVCRPSQQHFTPALTRSILTWNGFEGNTCKLVRVLSDSKNIVDRPSPEISYGNVNLRYLAYQHPCDTHPTWKLPTSVSLMWNLQTLMITTKFVLSCPAVVAPSNIWKMRHLRHIKFPQIYLPPPLSKKQDDLFILENLQTLTRALNLRLSEEVCKSIPNIKKLCLYYHRYLLGGNEDGWIECLSNLDRLLKLESLKMNIQSRFEVHSPSYELHKKLAFPSSLKKLSLSHCRLHWKDLSMIGSLPQLQVLYLEDSSVTEGKQWSPVNEQFCNLKFLKIQKCQLFYWDADNSHFPVLEKLVLRGLVNLKEIPPDMGEIPTLELIRVDECSESAAISAMRIKEEQLETQENDTLQIQVGISKLKA